MIGYLKGWVVENRDGHLIVSTASPESAGALGYSVTVPLSAVYLGLDKGRSVELFIYTHVREDTLDLYGFANSSEKELFLTLLGVKGIGPKGAMGILSKVEPSQLIQAISEGDKESLTRIPGIGKKTAERVVLELGDTIAKKLEAGLFGESRATAPAGATAALSPERGDRALLRDAREALVGLGYREQDVAPLLKKVLEEKPEQRRVEEVVRTALQRLSQ